ncbi:MAG: enoyl-CoA hydratase [Gemmatimonadetes bacterium]|nr:enoyl-CoA hydratase [Gemmatimonadota bacterium]
MTDFTSVLTRRDGTVGTVVLNRPDKLNAFDGVMRRELVAAFRQVADDPAVRVVILTGAGRAFCAGADISYMQSLLERRDWDAATELVEAGRKVVTAIRDTPKPVIAAVNGPAAGGGANLALACDLRIASDRAAIGQTFNQIGLCPDWGGTYFLPRLVGPAKALELFLSGEVIDAAEAYRIGLFNRVVPHDRLEPEVSLVAAQLAAKAPLAVALAKRAVYSSDANSLDQMLDLELANQVQCFQSEDAAEGLRAFLEKRTPAFLGK